MPQKHRTIVYIDGYNWYHAIFKHRPEWKWLNIQSFFEAMRPDEDILLVKFFTAIVDEEKLDSDARERHIKYVDALKTLLKVRVILGKFQDREVTCRANCKLKYKVPEEKKTDVNIAVEILSDAFKGNCDSMVVVSGDSDAQPPLQWVKANCSGIKISVYIPALIQEQALRRLDFYRRMGVTAKFLPLTDLKSHQLPNLVKLGGGNVSMRPTVWSAPKQPQT